MNKENIKLLNGDCLELMQNIQDKSIDLILTDPPYGTTKCKWDSIIPFDKMWKQLNRVIKDNGAIVLFGAEPYTSYLICSNVKHFKQKLTWKKHKAPNFGCAKYMHLKYTEDIVVFSNKKTTFNPQMIPRKSERVREAQKGKSKNWHTIKDNSNEVSFGTEYKGRSWDVYNANFKYPEDVLEFPAVVSNSHEKVNHPTQKPVALLQYLIKTYINENETVLDFTMGSGSTGVAAINTNRKFIGIELNKNYFEIAKNRINETIIQKDFSQSEFVFD